MALQSLTLGFPVKADVGLNLCFHSIRLLTDLQSHSWDSALPWTLDPIHGFQPRALDPILVPCPVSWSPSNGGMPAPFSSPLFATGMSLNFRPIIYLSEILSISYFRILCLSPIKTCHFLFVTNCLPMLLLAICHCVLPMEDMLLSLTLCPLVVSDPSLFLLVGTRPPQDSSQAWTISHE